jgi:hypothetical protein
MIRRTNRLSAFLASNGHGVRKENWEDPFVEAEFVETESATAEDSGVTFPATTPEFDIFVLNRLMARKVECEITVQTGDGPTHILIDENDAVLQSDTKIDILWLSEDEFVTPHHGFWSVDDDLRAVTRLCDMKVKLGEVSVYLVGYRFLPIEEDESQVEPSWSGLPFRFLAHMLAPNVHMVSRMQFTFGLDSPADAVLFVFPTTTAQNITKDIEITFEGESSHVVLAMSERPIHHHVVLCLDGEFSGLMAHQMNIVLRRYRHRLRLHVPIMLWEFEPVGETFTVNPAIESLTLSQTNNRKLSPKLLNGIARNQGHVHMSIIWDIHESSRYGFKCPPWIVAVFREVLRPGSHLRVLTIKFNYYAETNMMFWGDEDWAYWDPVRIQREAFEQVILNLDSDLTNRRNLSILQLTCNGADCKKRRKTSRPWDARFSLGVALNWLHCQQVPPSPKASGLAVRSINQGFLFKFNTILGTWDPAASRASAIYDILRPWMGDT